MVPRPMPFVPGLPGLPSAPIPPGEQNMVAVAPAPPLPAPGVPAEPSPPLTSAPMPPRPPLDGTPAHIFVTEFPPRTCAAVHAELPGFPGAPAWATAVYGPPSLPAAPPPDSSLHPT